MFDHQLRQEIVLFLVGFHFFDDPDRRKALLLSAGLDTILPNLELTGTPQEFVTRLVKRLDEYGTLPDSTRALVQLLQQVATQVGTDKRQILQSFCDRLATKPIQPNVSIPLPQSASSAAVHTSPSSRPATPGIWITVTVALVVLIGAGVIWFTLDWQKRHQTPATPAVSASRTVVPTIKPTIPPQPTPTPVMIRLRSQPMMVPEENAEQTWGLKADITTYGYPVFRPPFYVKNVFERQGDVIIDHVTSLMWQQAGSGKLPLYRDAQAYIATLNQQKLVGYADWRMPTVNELLSLLTEENQPNGLYIATVFDAKQSYCWTADMNTAYSAWDVNFNKGYARSSLQIDGYVRAVRSLTL